MYVGVDVNLLPLLLFYVEKRMGICANINQSVIFVTTNEVPDSNLMLFFITHFKERKSG